MVREGSPKGKSETTGGRICVTGRITVCLVLKLHLIGKAVT